MTRTSFRDALDEHLAALQARDIDRFAATLGSDAITVDGAARTTRGTDAVARAHAAWFASADRWSFEYEVTYARELGDAGIALLDVRYRNEPAVEAARFVLSLVFERGVDGEYRMIFDQNTPTRAAGSSAP